MNDGKNGNKNGKKEREFEHKIFTYIFISQIPFFPDIIFNFCFYPFFRRCV